MLAQTDDGCDESAGERARQRDAEGQHQRQDDHRRHADQVEVGLDLAADDHGIQVALFDRVEIEAAHVEVEAEQCQRDEQRGPQVGEQPPTVACATGRGRGGVG
jgi:hypothetical protein